ncbi:hypothetical protein H109_02639 [Trichophyton interdigitale MR816]|uniref:Protein FYV10 n=2 Tax=Trichophyton interdigitale (strain MR816) TaxID=1215338 RepID=A0A059JDG8_TRIIM|nr:hypothetical protein H101_06101 [Trichophyton interdigitale H6]KDB25527.1 hypothetical protein H109_02639 [Trichophyton interdigitale MR816]
MASANLMSPTPSTATPTWSNFEKKMEEHKPSKMDINYLVMDYLVTNGYPSAANKFAAEANIPQRHDSDMVQERVEIRNAIYSGNIQSAIEKLNELNPQLLDDKPELHFSLLRLQLIELIRNCITTPNADITPALDFATSQLAPRAPTAPQFIKELEETMSLLIFSPENLSAPLNELLDPAMRKTVAAKVNEAILQRQGSVSEARLRALVKLRVWSEKMARNSKKDIPDKLDIGFDNDATNGNETNGSAGQDDVVMQERGDLDSMVH